MKTADNIYEDKITPHPNPKPDPGIIPPPPKPPKERLDD